MRAAEIAIAYERPKLATMEITREVEPDASLLGDLLSLMDGTGSGLPSSDIERPTDGAVQGPS